VDTLFPFYLSAYSIKRSNRKAVYHSNASAARIVNVEVKNGDVLLTGTVDSWMEYNAAANNAYEGGAVYVDNELNVK